MRRATSIGHLGTWIDVPLQSILRDWHTGRGPLYDQVACALRDAIERGDLPPGNRLPPERVLATYLGVGRHTVARAYEALHRLELVDRRQGSGTTVSGADSPLHDNRSAKLATTLQRNIVFRSLGHAPEPTIDLLSVYAPMSDALANEVLEAAGSQLAGLALDHHGYTPAGFPPLRAAIAQRFTADGIPTDEEQILITSGAQQAISLMASAFVKPGQHAVLEDPTVPGAIDAFSAVGARPLAVPVHETGADVDALAAMLARNTAGAVYLMPTYQSPTGAVMPEDARRSVVDLAARTGVAVIEDATLTDVSIHGDPPPPLAAYAGSAPVLSIGSFSKILWAGLRVGWIRGPRTIIAHLARLKAVTDLGTSLVSQAVVLTLLGDLDRIKQLRRREMTRKLERMERMLRADFHGWTWRTPPGGLCLWVRLPAGSALEFTQVARQHGVAIAPGSVTSPTNSFDDRVRLPFGYRQHVVEAGMQRLAAAWRVYADALAQQARDVRSVVV